MLEQVQPIGNNYNNNQRIVVKDIMEDIAGYSLDLSLETPGQVRDSTSGGDYNYTKMLMGKMLTIIDSVIEEKERRDAIKSLVKQAITQEKKQLISILYERYREYKLINENCKGEGCGFVTANESGLCTPCENK